MVFDLFAPVLESVGFLLLDRFPRAATTGPIWRRVLAIAALLTASFVIAIVVVLVGAVVVALARAGSAALDHH